MHRLKATAFGRKVGKEATEFVLMPKKGAENQLSALIEGRRATLIEI